MARSLTSALPNDVTCTWWIVCDNVEVPTAVRQALPAFAQVHAHHDPRSLSGNAQRNYALDRIPATQDCWVYFLDDDTELQPAFYEALAACDSHELQHFAMLHGRSEALYVDGKHIAAGQIDTGCLLYHRRLIGDIRWSLNRYEADLHFASACARRAKTRRYISRPLARYNSLREHPSEKSQPAHLLAFLSHHKGDKHLSVSSPHSSLADQMFLHLAGALIADATSLTLHLEGRRDLGFRLSAFLPAPKCELTLSMPYLQEADLLARMTTFSEANPGTALSILAFEVTELAQTLLAIPPEHCQSVFAEVRQSWRIFPIRTLPETPPAHLKVAFCAGACSVDLLKWALDQFQTWGHTVELSIFGPEPEGLRAVCPHVHASTPLPEPGYETLVGLAYADVLFCADTAWSYVAAIVNPALVLHAPGGWPSDESWWPLNEDIPPNPEAEAQLRDRFQSTN